MREALQNFRCLIGIFFSETLRSRRTSVRRAAEIARRIAEVLPKAESENQVLNGLVNIEKDFSEIGELRHALHFGYNPEDIKIYEKEVKEYAAEAFKSNMEASVAFLQDAAKQEMTIGELCIKYPHFCEYLVNETEKGQIFKELKPQIA